LTLKINYREIHPKRQKEFWATVDVRATDKECWLWRGSTIRGYGIFFDGTHQVKAHRYAWTIEFGPIPRGEYVLHKCDNKACSNPSHLFLGSQNDNMKDMVHKRRQALHQGKENGRAKIPEQDIPKIRQRADSGENMSEIAKEYGVHRVTIKAIKDRVRWSHVPEHGPNWKETHA
jgi:hypothetical protein